MMTRAEVRDGTMRGPFYSAVEVDANINAAPGSWRALHRFAIEQGLRWDGSIKQMAVLRQWQSDWHECVPLLTRDNHV
jgi:hypothetical protein